jgi:hypothetical protein
MSSKHCAMAKGTRRGNQCRVDCYMPVAGSTDCTACLHAPVCLLLAALTKVVMSDMCKHKELWSDKTV